MAEIFEEFSIQIVRWRGHVLLVVVWLSVVVLSLRAVDLPLFKLISNDIWTSLAESRVIHIHSNLIL